MSNLLKEAIVDAKALREAALKSAETKIIDKYSVEVRKTLDQLLEQDELGGDLGLDLGGELPMEDPGALPGEMGMEEPVDPEEVVDEEDVPLAATDGLSKNKGIGLSGLPKEGDKVEFNLNLDALNEAIESLETQLEFEELDVDEEELIEILSEDDEEIEIDESITTGSDEIFGAQEDESTASEDDGPAEGETAGVAAGEAAAKTADAEQMKGLSEDSGIPEELIDAIMEKLSVDMRADLGGWAGRSSYEMKWEMEKEMAHRRSTEVEKEIEILKKAQEELVFENKQLEEKLLQYKQATKELKEGLQDVNLSNARLLYTNRVLRNTSLNERQKETIVEAISRADSVTEARTIFDTLQSTAQSTPQRGPQSLSEAINRRSSSSVIHASRHEKIDSDPFQERMKRLAGIK